MLSLKKTRNYLLFCLVGGLLACATSPQVNPWDSIEVPLEAVETPLPCDELPAPVVLDEIGKGRIAAMRECAMANYDIASEHVTQIEQMRLATHDLIDAGQHQRRIAEMKQEMLDDERRHNFWNNLGLYVVIIALGFSI